MSLRTEFVLFASQDGANIRALCRRYGISPASGYKWLRRWAESGSSGLQDRPRIPHHSPNRSPDGITDPYDRYDNNEKKLEALLKWENKLKEIVNH